MESDYAQQMHEHGIQDNGVDTIFSGQHSNTYEMNCCGSSEYTNNQDRNHTNTNLASTDVNIRQDVQATRLWSDYRKQVDTTKRGTKHQ